MQSRRVFITGVGFACPLGIGSHDVFDQFIAGANGVHDEQYEHPVARVNALDPVKVMGSKKDVRRNDRVVHLAAAAAAEALTHADLEFDDIDDAQAARYGVIIGTGIGGIGTLIAQHDVFLEKGPEGWRLLGPVGVPQAP